MQGGSDDEDHGPGDAQESADAVGDAIGDFFAHRLLGRHDFGTHLGHRARRIRDGGSGIIETADARVC